MRKPSYLLPLSLISLIILVSCTAAVVAQNREKFVISAKAGGINAVTGQASVHGRGESDWQQLMITDDLEAGDRVRTDSDGRVEILLNPGSYLRLGGNSEVELADNSLANLEVKLIRGTAIVEATGGEGTELMINISTPHARLAIVREGLYRLNVVPGDATELIVRKGRVLLNDKHTKVKGGNKVIFSATSIAVAKLTKEEKKSREDVELWSKERAQSLAKANRRITDRMLTSAFSGMSVADARFFSYRRPGFWFFNYGAGCYTFLPFSFGWSSPYGSSYQTAIFPSYGGMGTRSNGITIPNPTSNRGSVSAPNVAYPGGSMGGASGISRPSAPTGSSSEMGNRATRKLETMTDPNRPN